MTQNLPPETVNLTTQQKKTVKEQKKKTIKKIQSTLSDNLTKCHKTGKYAYLDQTEVKKDVWDLNSHYIKELSDKNQNLGPGTVSSPYQIYVSLTIDFIGSIAYGELFQLQVNPLGWDTVFMVAGIDHEFSQSGDAKVS